MFSAKSFFKRAAFHAARTALTPERPRRARKTHNSMGDALPRSDGIELEISCNDTLKRAGWKSRRTGGSGDRGCDILANYNGYTLCVQCKDTYAAVGSQGVQQALAGQAYYRTNYAAVVSRTGFTESAHEVAKMTRVELLHPSDLATLHQKLRLPKKR